MSAARASNMVRLCCSPSVTGFVPPSISTTFPWATRNLGYTHVSDTIPAQCDESIFLKHMGEVHAATVRIDLSGR
jgi:hypothetical protein